MQLESESPHTPPLTPPPTGETDPPAPPHTGPLPPPPPPPGSTDTGGD